MQTLFLVPDFSYLSPLCPQSVSITQLLTCCWRSKEKFYTLWQKHLYILWELLSKRVARGQAVIGPAWVQKCWAESEKLKTCFSCRQPEVTSSSIQLLTRKATAEEPVIILSWTMSANWAGVKDKKGLSVCKGMAKLWHAFSTGTWKKIRLCHLELLSGLLLQHNTSLFPELFRY